MAHTWQAAPALSQGLWTHGTVSGYMDSCSGRSGSEEPWCWCPELVGGGDGVVFGQVQQLSKVEVEDLLRKGAYGALMDEEDEGSKFCEEDIDQILQRRTQTITIQSEGKGSTFAKVCHALRVGRELPHGAEGATLGGVAQSCWRGLFPVYG